MASFLMWMGAVVMGVIAIVPLPDADKRAERNFMVSLPFLVAALLMAHYA